MKKMVTKKASAWVLAGAMSLAAAGGATVALADNERSAPATGIEERASSYLQATQKELASTGISVSRIDLAAIRDGVDYFALRGDRDHCILAAKGSSPAGASDALACAPNDTARPLGLPITGADFRAVGYVFWTDGGALSATGGDSDEPLKVTPAELVSVVELSSPDQALSVTWVPRVGERVTFPVQSAAEMEREAQEKFATLAGK